VFDVLTFADDVVPFFGRFVPADPDVVGEARSRVRAQEIRGGTDILGALRAAVAYPWPEDDRLAVPRIVFLTDGAVSNEDAVLREIVARLGNVRLHALGIGAAPNRWLLRAMAERGGGLCAFVRSDEPGESGIDRFLERVDRPVWSSPRLAWSGAVPQETYPSRLPDLHAGEAITVVARFGPGETPAGLTVAGSTPSGPVEVEVDARGTEAEPTGIGTRWARAKVDDLLGGLHEGAAEADVRPRVVAVALAHGLVTRYTARVAVETYATASRDAVRVDVPNVIVVPLPQGGTLRPLARLAGIVCALAGTLLWLAARRCGG